MESEKIGIDNLTYKAEIETQMQRTNIWIPRGKGVCWDELGDWDWHIYTIDTMYKQITNENLLYSSGNSTQCSVVT